jgi:hypothetical protein
MLKGSGYQVEPAETEAAVCTVPAVAHYLAGGISEAIGGGRNRRSNDMSAIRLS